MTNGTQWTDTDLDRLRIEGLDHLNRLQSGTATVRDRDALRDWRSRSDAHEQAFRSAVRLQQSVRAVARGVRFAREPSAGPAQIIAFDEAVRGRRISRRAFVGGAMAASVAGMVTVGRALDVIPSARTLGADYRTGAGQRRQVALSGGAHVDLNTRTSIRLRDDLGMPAVELIDGEAVVTSASGGRVALIAGNGRSIGQSARFNARRDGDEVCITCLSGTVTVSAFGESRELRPSAEVRYGDRAIGQARSGVDAGVLTAWQTGTLIFRDLPMRAVIDEINRYRPGRIFLADRRLAERRLTGTYHIQRLDEFFSQARLGLGVVVTRLPGDVVVLS